MATCYSVSLFNEVAQHLKYENYHFFMDVKLGVIHFGISTKGNINNIQYHIIVKDSWFVTYAVFPISGDIRDKNQMTELSKYLHIINCNLLHGSCELDLRDGEIRIKYFVNCDGIIPSEEIIEDSVQCPAAIFDRYGKGILGIIFNHMNAEEAVQFCERPIYTADPGCNTNSGDSNENEDYIPLDALDFLDSLFDNYDDLDESDPYSDPYDDIK